MSYKQTDKTYLEPVSEEAQLLIWQLSIEINCFMKTKNDELRWEAISKYSEMLEILTDLFVGNFHSYKLLLVDLLTLNILSQEKIMRMELYSAIERFFIVLNEAVKTDGINND
jgi:hypothetical protein